MTAAIVLDGARRRFGATHAVRGLDLQVEAGEIFGLVGPDGAGKTTTIRMIAGLVDPDGGTVRVLGMHPDHPAARAATGLLPQRYSLYGDLTVAENLDFFRQLQGVRADVAAPRRARLLEITRLGPFQDRRADALSGGMYKKLALAAALLHQPKVLLLDEPTNGVDPVSRRELWELLGEFVSDGMAVLVTTPYMDEAERCHRVALMHDGRILAEGSPAELVRAFEHPVCLVEGLSREAAEAALRGVDGVIASSPAGARLRLVLDADAAPAIHARLTAAGASLRAVRPGFEDLFLAATREAA
jgi:ABC-2 type transport system ATP-binding protein